MARKFVRRQRPYAPHIGATRAATFAGAGIVLLAALSVACVTAAAARRPGSQGIEQLRWLVGCWSMTTPAGLAISEEWRRPARDTLAGIGLTTRGGSIVSSEVLRIVATADTIVYSALPSGQTYTEFRATSLREGEVIFENPEHDFPQRVIYASGPGPDSLRARIEGTTQGRSRSTSLALARVACPAR